MKRWRTILFTIVACTFAGHSADDRGGAPDWTPRLKQDVFTFARIRYTSTSRDRRTHWTGDYPDADLNFSHRLQQLTSLEVDPDGKVFDLTDTRLLNYPFAYLSSPGRMYLREEEVAGLRRYCLNGGFIMVDDFWGQQHWDNAYEEFKRAFPNREPKELPLSHPIFNVVYQLEKKPQVPSIRAWRMGHKIEPWHGDMTDPAPHFRALYDDKGRIMVLFCHNNDLADGWEREGENIEYFRYYSEPQSYPMGINIVIYAMTH
ncbi:MAG: DUF4159 domain-containing protein [Limisphaerales bacterium]